MCDVLSKPRYTFMYKVRYIGETVINTGLEKNSIYDVYSDVVLDADVEGNKYYCIENDGRKFICEKEFCIILDEERNKKIDELLKYEN